MEVGGGDGRVSTHSRSNRTLSIGRPLLAPTGSGRDRAASAPGDDGHVPLAEQVTKNKLGTLLGVYLPWCVWQVWGTPGVVRCVGWRKLSSGSCCPPVRTGRPFLAKFVLSHTKLCASCSPPPPPLPPVWCVDSILSIFGAILFLRLPWSIGQAGVLGALLLFALAGITIILTVMSIAAISTNGNMKGGGAYYMISRALGPEFGGAVGLVFFAANTLGITFYLIAFASEIHSMVGGGHWMVTLYASGALFLLLLVGLGGANIFAKLNFFVASCLTVSIVAALASFLFGKKGESGYTGFSGETFSNNFDFGFTDGYSFFSVFVVVFPAMTGVMAGANMSGDLKDPGHSIGYGTMAAVFTALVVYTILLLVIGATVERDELRSNYNVMQDICFYRAFVAVGVICSTVSSAMGNLVGSGRILQALARDNLFPCLTIFGWGSKKGDEPRVAVLCAWAIAQGCLFIGDLNAVASIISGFFLLVYFFTNLACFVLRISGAPNFRPRFKYFTWHTALLGALLCFAILFISGATYATIAIIVRYPALFVFCFCLFAPAVLAPTPSCCASCLWLSPLWV